MSFYAVSTVGLSESDSRDIATPVVQYRHPNGRASTTRLRASLLGLLHVLWSRTELNRHNVNRVMCGPGAGERLRRLARAKQA